jgi:hypothetical protein
MAGAKGFFAECRYPFSFEAIATLSIKIAPDIHHLCFAIEWATGVDGFSICFFVTAFIPPLGTAPLACPEPHSTHR